MNYHSRTLIKDILSETFNQPAQAYNSILI